MITTIELINTSIPSHTYHCVCVWRLRARTCPVHDEGVWVEAGGGMASRRHAFACSEDIWQTHLPQLWILTRSSPPPRPATPTIVPLPAAAPFSRRFGQGKLESSWIPSQPTPALPSANPFWRITKPTPREWQKPHVADMAVAPGQSAGSAAGPSSLCPCFYPHHPLLSEGLCQNTKSDHVFLCSKPPPWGEQFCKSFLW